MDYSEVRDPFDSLHYTDEEGGSWIDFGRIARGVERLEGQLQNSALSPRAEQNDYHLISDFGNRNKRDEVAAAVENRYETEIVSGCRLRIGGVPEGEVLSLAALAEDADIEVDRYKTLEDGIAGPVPETP